MERDNRQRQKTEGNRIKTQTYIHSQRDTLKERHKQRNTDRETQIERHRKRRTDREIRNGQR